MIGKAPGVSREKQGLLVDLPDMDAAESSDQLFCDVPASSDGVCA